LPVENVVIVLVGTVIISGIVAAANYAERERHNRLYGFVLGSLVVLGLFLVLAMVAQVLSAYSESVAGETDVPDKAEAWGGFAMAVITTGLVVALALRPVREKIAAVFPQYEKTKADNQAVASAAARRPDADSEPLFPQMLNYYTADSVLLPRPSDQWGHKAKRALPATRGGFNPYSVVHTTALMLCLYFFSTQVIGFVLSGGLKGVADEFASGLSVWDVILTAIPQVVIPVIGVGWGIRRNLPQTLQRLGLDIPTVEQLGVAFGVVVLLFVFIITVSLVWQGAVSEKTFEEQSQASQALSESIGTLWMAFFISAMAGVSEEIAFRGALQPIFGLWPTSLLFALIHMQYTLTPATLIIFGVALAFGWLRLKYNTTVAIMAHFLYNFVQLALAVSTPDETASWIVHML
jgi:membrane protease YdiL (CAAX protease family)